MQRTMAYILFSHMGAMGLLNWMQDEQYLKTQYYLKMHRKLNLDNPVTMNEKLQWLKIHDRKSCYCEYVDKYLVRDHIKRAVGSEVLIPLIGVWESPKDIDFNMLPNQFVLKCNHDSGGVIICKDKSKLDVNKTRRVLNRKQHKDYSLGNREWPYKNVHRCVLAEQYLEDGNKEGSIIDYKFYCFNGIPECVIACVDRTPKNAKFIYYDNEWNRLDYNFQTFEERNCKVCKPDNFSEMIDIAKKIAMYVDCAFIRVDLFNVNKKIYFGEITFYPHSGMDTTLRPEIDCYFGSKIRLPLE